MDKNLFRVLLSKAGLREFHLRSLGGLQILQRAKEALTGREYRASASELELRGVVAFERRVSTSAELFTSPWARHLGEDEFCDAE